jgi:hypothetical protein
MATRKKTVRFTANSISIVNNTLTAFAQFTAYIPEATRTITDAWIKVGFQDIVTATGGSIANWQVTYSVGGVAAQSITNANAIASTGENISGILGPLSVTAHTVANFGAGGSNTVDVSLLMNQSTGTTLGMVNCTAELFITYEYDDTATTQIKTVVIPLESRVNALATTEAQIGTNQVPQLTGVGGLLPEASVVIRSYYFVIDGNTHGGNTTTDAVLNARIDATGAAITFSSTENALATNRWNEFIWNLTAAIPDATLAHEFYLWATGVASYNHACIKLVVTYEFDSSTTTRVLNSIQVPLELITPSGNTAATDNSRLERSFFVEEPNVSLVQSGFQLMWGATASISGLNVRAGGQAYRAYTDNAMGLCGQVSLTHRVDSGSAQGDGFTLARGRNTLTVDLYGTSASAYMSSIVGIAFVNYLSDVATPGIGAHNHTIYETKRDFSSAAVSVQKMTGLSVAIPESDYYLNSVGINLMSMATASGGIAVAIKRGDGLGWDTGYEDTRIIRGELGEYYSTVQIWDTVFKPYPQSIIGINIETSRDWIQTATSAIRFGFGLMLTYHSISYTVAGTVVGYTGDGSGITVDLIDEATGGLLNSATTAIGGGFTMVWYDNVRNVYCAAKQGVDRAGRSLSGVSA